MAPPNIDTQASGLAHPADTSGVPEVDGEVLAAGTLLGSYGVGELLGKGGMGHVYNAEHLRLGRKVALKMLRSKFNANATAIARFFAEARAVNTISHENIVEITDFVENDAGNNYYIMELLKGQDLGQLLWRLGVVPVLLAVDIAAQIAGALAAVHDGNIVHRDLKPDNIFLVERPGRPNFVKLLDFGVAKLSCPDGIPLGTTGEGMIIGTPEYMSPEQACGLPVDHRTDIYALGVVLYEMVTGTSPFKATSFGEMVVNHVTVTPTPPRDHTNLPHEIPQEVEALILSLLAKDPADRPQSMKEVERRLLEIQDALVPVTIVVDRTSARLDAVRISSEQVAIKIPSTELATVAATGHESTMPAMLPGELESSASATMGITRQPRHRWSLIIGGTALAVACCLVLLAARGVSDRTATLPARSVAANPIAIPATPGSVLIHFRSEPAGAVVRVVGSELVLGTTPFSREVRRGDEPVAFQFSLDGQLDTQQLVPSQDATIVARIAPAQDGASQRTLASGAQSPAAPIAVVSAGSDDKSANRGTAKHRATQVKNVDRGGVMRVFPH